MRKIYHCDSNSSQSIVRKVLVALGLTINNDPLPKEFLIDRAIEDILNGIVVVAAGLQGMSIT